MSSATLIREARLRAGLTQSELASRAHTTQSAVARWEAGRSHPSFETLRNLIDLCGLEIRVEISEPDADEETLIESNLALTPVERLEQLVRAVAFIEAGRMAVAKAGG